MNNIDQQYIEKAICVLQSKDMEAKSQLEETIELLHIYLQSKNVPGNDIPDNVINFKSVVSRDVYADPN